MTVEVSDNEIPTIEKEDIVFFDTNFISPKSGNDLHPIYCLLYDLKILFDLPKENIKTSPVVIAEYRRQLIALEKKFTFEFPKVSNFITELSDFNGKLKKFQEQSDELKVAFSALKGLWKTFHVSGNLCKHVMPVSQDSLVKTLEWLKEGKYFFFSKDDNKEVKRHTQDALIVSDFLRLLEMHKENTQQIYHFLSSDEDCVKILRTILKEDQTYKEYQNRVCFVVKSNKQDSDKTLGISPWDTMKASAKEPKEKILQELLKKLPQTPLGRFSSEGGANAQDDGKIGLSRQVSKLESWRNTEQKDSDLVNALTPYMEEQKYWHITELQKSNFNNLKETLRKKDAQTSEVVQEAASKGIEQRQPVIDDNIDSFAKETEDEEPEKFLKNFSNFIRTKYFSSSCGEDVASKTKKYLSAFQHKAENINWSTRKKEAAEILDFLFRTYHESALQDNNIPVHFRTHPVKECLETLVQKSIFYKKYPLQSYIVKSFQKHFNDDKFFESFNIQPGSFTRCIAENFLRDGTWRFYLQFSPANADSIAQYSLPKTCPLLGLLKILIKLYSHNTESAYKNHALLELINNGLWCHGMDGIGGENVSKIQKEIFDLHLTIWDTADAYTKYLIDDKWHALNKSCGSIPQYQEREKAIDQKVQDDIWYQRYRRLLRTPSRYKEADAAQEYVKEIDSPQTWSEWKQRINLWLSEERMGSHPKRLCSFLKTLGQKKPQLLYDDLRRNNYFFLKTENVNLGTLLIACLSSLFSTEEREFKEKAEELLETWIKNKKADSDEVMAVPSVILLSALTIEKKQDWLQKIWRTHKSKRPKYIFIYSMVRSLSWISNDMPTETFAPLMMDILGSTDQSTLSRLIGDIFGCYDFCDQRITEYLLRNIENDEKKKAWIFGTFFNCLTDAVLEFDRNPHGLDVFLKAFIEKGFLKEVLGWAVKYASAIEERTKYSRLRFGFLNDQRENILGSLEILWEWHEAGKDTHQKISKYIFRDVINGFREVLLNFIKADKDNDKKFSFAIDILRSSQYGDIDFSDESRKRNEEFIVEILLAYAGTATDDQLDGLEYFWNHHRGWSGDEDIDEIKRQEIERLATHADKRVRRFWERFQDWD